MHFTLGYITYFLRDNVTPFFLCNYRIVTNELIYLPTRDLLHFSFGEELLHRMERICTGYPMRRDAHIVIYG